MVSETVDSCGTVFIFVDDGDGDLKKIDLCLADGMREDLILGIPEINKLNLLGLSSRSKRIIIVRVKKM
jgi:hypothetical protein